MVPSFLQLRPGEGAPVLLLLALTFTSGVALVSFETAAYALLIDFYDAAQLPWVYLVSAGVTSLIGYLYTRLEQRLPPERLLPGTLGAMFVSVLGLRILLVFHEHSWVLMWVLLWQDVLTMLSILATWGVVLRSLTVRQGKRLFGLINSGELLGGMAAGLTAGLLVGTVDTANLLFVAASSLLLGLTALTTFLHRYPNGFAGSEDGASEDSDDEEESDVGLLDMLRQPYLRLIFGLSAISVVGFFGLDYVYSDQVERTFQSEDDLARFLGPVAGLGQLATLLGTGLLSSRLLGRWGVRRALLVVPAALLAMGAASALAPAESGMLFALVVSTKMLDSFLRGSVEDSAMLVLYQPLEPRLRAGAQAVAEGVVEPLAVGLASLLLFAVVGDGQDVQAVILVLLLPTAIWLVLSLRVGEGYASALVAAIDRRGLGSPGLALDDASTLDIFRRKLASPHPGEVIYCLDALTRAAHPELGALLHDLLTHPSAAVRREVLDRIERRAQSGEEVDPDALAQVADVEQVPEVRAVALRVLCALSADSVMDRADDYLKGTPALVQRATLVGLLRGGDVGVVLTVGDWLRGMAESAEVEQRALVAEVLGDMGARAAWPLLLPLLDDGDANVSRAALSAAVRVRHPRLWPRLVVHLELAGHRAAAAEALVAAGPEALLLLGGILSDPARPRALRARVADIAGRIGGTEASSLLESLVSERDEQVRHHVLRALAATGYRAPAAALPRLQALMSEEIELFTTLLSTRQPLPRESPWKELRAALLSEALQARERVFWLLAVMYDARRLELARRGLEHRWAQRRAWALEVVDVQVPADLRGLVLPLIDEISEEERLERLIPRFPQRARSPAELVGEIVRGESGTTGLWVLLCALRIAAVLRATWLQGDVAALLGHPEPSVRETALWTLADLDTAPSRPVAAEGGAEARPSGIVRDGKVTMLLIVEKVIILKSVEIFSQTPEEILVDVAHVLKEVQVKAGETIIHKGDMGSSMYFIVSGKMLVHEGENVVAELSDREIVGELAVLDPQPRSHSVTAGSDAVLLQLDQDALYELMTDRVEVARGIIKVLCGKLRAVSRRNTELVGG